MGKGIYIQGMLYNSLYGKQGPIHNPLTSSIQNFSDRDYWNQVHGRKIYVHRLTANGRYMIGCWRVYPKWKQPIHRSAYKFSLLLVALLLFSCSPTVTINHVVVKSPKRAIPKQDFFIYMGTFWAGYFGFNHFKPRK